MLLTPPCTLVFSSPLLAAAACLQQNFEYEEVKAFIDTSIEPILGNQVYAPKKVGDWTSAIVEAVLKLLQAANKPFKYVVTCIIMQKNGAGLHTASTCFWDTKSDGERTGDRQRGGGACMEERRGSGERKQCVAALAAPHSSDSSYSWSTRICLPAFLFPGSCSVRWDNATMHAIVTVFALHI